MTAADGVVYCDVTFKNIENAEENTHGESKKDLSIYLSTKYTKYCDHLCLLMDWQSQSQMWMFV